MPDACNSRAVLTQTRSLEDNAIIETTFVRLFQLSASTREHC